MYRNIATGICISLTLFSCKTQPAEKLPDHFTLTETMMKRCEFTRSRLENVKYELKLFGKVEADNSKMAHVYPVTGGIVSKVNVELGDFVEQGQLLATVRSSEVADFERQ